MFASPEVAATQAREHVWKYFELHAQQRIAVFNFFLVLSGALAAGLAATLQGSQRFASLGIALGVLLAFVSFLFWKLDQRVAFLVKHAEASLAEIEGFFSDPEVQVFLQEPSKTTAAKRQASLWRRQWSYGCVFRVLFSTMAVVGVSGSVLCGLRFLGYIAW
jgi:cyanate permease